MRIGNTAWITNEKTQKMDMMSMCNTMMCSVSVCDVKMYDMMRENEMYCPISPDI